MRSRFRAVFASGLLALGLGAAACKGAPSTAGVESGSPAKSGDAPASAAGSACPAAPVPATGLPGTDETHETLDRWLSGPNVPAEFADRELVSLELADELNAQSNDVKGAWREPSARTVGLPEQVTAGIEERMNYLERQLTAGVFVEAERESFDAAQDVIANSSGVDHQRLVLEETQLWCIPIASGLYKEPIDRDFDRNACASLHPAERIRVLRRGQYGKWLYVHAGHTVGWVHAAKLTGRLSQDDLERWQSPRQLVGIRDDAKTVDGFPIRIGVSVPIVEDAEDGYRVLVPSKDGLVSAKVEAGEAVHDGFRPLTRRALFETAFSTLGAPYGWGGRAGGRDCSRFLRDVFFTFGIQLGRHSGVQAQLGARSIDVSELSEQAKREAIDTWAQRGAVLLYMPGHIMLYLGRDEQRQFAISSISEYATPCEGGDDTVHRIDAVAVGTLELGRGAERRSFIERITKLAVFGPGLSPDPPQTPDPEG